MANPLTSVLQKAKFALSSVLLAGKDWSGAIEGMDISKWQDPSKINFPAARPTHPYVIIKAVGGLVEDPKFTIHWTSAAASGMLIAVYLYWYDDLDPVAQANKLDSVVEPLTEVLGYSPRVYIDVERQDMSEGISNATRIARLKATKDTLEAKGYRVAGYSNKDTIDTCLSPAPAWLVQFFEWLASYTSGTKPALPSGFTDQYVKLWQYGIWAIHWWAKAILGCQPNIDKDRFAGTQAELLQYFGPPAPIPPPVPPTDPGECEFGAKLKDGFDSLRMRSSPDTSSTSNVVDHIYPTDELKVIFELVIGADVWWAIIKESNRLGWAAQKYGGVVYLEKV